MGEPEASGERVGVPARRWIRRDDVLWRYVDNGVLVLAAGDGDPRMLRGVTAPVWRLLAEPMTVDEMAAALSRHADEPAASIRRDLLPLLERLHGDQLVMNDER